MKWLILLMLAVLPAIAAAEDEPAPAAPPAEEAAPAAETVPAAETAPAAEPAADAVTQDTPRAGEPVPAALPAEKGAAAKGGAGESSGVVFQSIDEMNKKWR